MFLCKVIGNVVSQQKLDSLVGKKMLLCERIDGSRHENVVAVDLVGAGIGSQVLVARSYCDNRNDRIDEWIVGIVDAVSE